MDIVVVDYEVIVADYIFIGNDIVVVVVIVERGDRRVVDGV